MVFAAPVSVWEITEVKDKRPVYNIRHVYTSNLGELAKIFRKK